MRIAIMYFLLQCTLFGSWPNKDLWVRCPEPKQAKYSLNAFCILKVSNRKKKSDLIKELRANLRCLLFN